MKCEYCGRTNHDDGHGGCYSCGAPVEPEYETYRAFSDYTYSTAMTAVSYSPRQPIARKRVSVSDI